LICFGHDLPFFHSNHNQYIGQVRGISRAENPFCLAPLAEEATLTIRMTAEHLTSRVAEAAEMILDAYAAGHGVFTFGNGGSALDAQHIALELVGRFLQDRRALRAQALTAAGGLLTCLGNDFGAEAVFSRQLEAGGAPGDIAIGLSTSGNSPNVVAALETARRLGMKTIALTGSGGGIIEARFAAPPVEDAPG